MNTTKPAAKKARKMVGQITCIRDGAYAVFVSAKECRWCKAQDGAVYSMADMVQIDGKNNIIKKI
jgi:hypothetical protein